MIKVLIQIAGGTSERRIYNEQTLEYLETRAGKVKYVYPYGFIPGTRSEDGGCVDCYVITDESLQAGEIVECEVVGLLEQVEGDEIDHKALAVLPNQPAELNQERVEKLKGFLCVLFANHPEVKIGNLLSREAALRHIEEFREK